MLVAASFPESCMPVDKCPLAAVHPPEDASCHDAVRKAYYEMHTKQTIEFVMKQHEEWLGLDKGEFTIMEIVDMLDKEAAGSALDGDMPSSADLKMAERARKMYPGQDWFHLVALLGGIGKLLGCKSFAGESALPQWAVDGDSFCVGCAPSEAIAFGLDSFARNPDLSHPVYKMKYGIYEPNCGISNLVMSWGRDEYLYWVLKKNGCTIPEHGLNMIRFHSFYPWHEKRAYTHLEEPSDSETLKWVKEFIDMELFSKGDELPSMDELRPYYQSLLEKYNIGGKLCF
eukprot:TRINITY_DN47137_c0_g1_i1.p1 TRINITY_DN47137_c0_g1~~TRINITY_DN47137_c0_g1_i1.p1  ORF type:complete len:286 (+),score=47.05 TRINITY_DN47137_c0_g1_i1:47-904(+)